MIARIETPRSYPAVHFSLTYPVKLNPCGGCGPSARERRYVTCVACLEVAIVAGNRVAADKLAKLRNPE